MGGKVEDSLAQIAISSHLDISSQLSANGNGGEYCKRAWHFPVLCRDGNTIQRTIDPVKE